MHELITVRLSDDLQSEVEQQLENSGQELGAFVREAIRRDLQRKALNK